MIQLCVHNYFINKWLLESRICLWPLWVRLSLMYLSLHGVALVLHAVLLLPSITVHPEVFVVRKELQPHTSLQDGWLINNISQHYGPHQGSAESIRPSKKSNKLTWPSSAGLTLQEMSFLKESASGLLRCPTPRCSD